VTGQPVISNHLESETRFRTPEFLAKHGVRRAVNVILQGEGAAYGVLEVDSRKPGEFSEHDLTFLQGAANLLAMAIERRRYDQRLKNSLDHQQALLKEVNHRVKNSLQLVVSMLRLQAASVGNEEVSYRLGEAQARVNAIARAHERLYRTTDFTHLDVTSYLCEVCEDLDGPSVSCDGPCGIMIATDRAIPLALLVSELVTNSLKHAYPGQSGSVQTTVAPIASGHLQISVADEGVGLPEGFDPDAPKTLGIQLVKSFAQKLDASLEFHRRTPGTEVIVVLSPETGSATPGS
jgi:two-component sensor histidine kinase